VNGPDFVVGSAINDVFNRMERGQIDGRMVIDYRTC
jgi:D-arabinose 1-dehydrogenase-like Zn-dependent alcohol dehydrogenase